MGLARPAVLVVLVFAALVLAAPTPASAERRDSAVEGMLQSINASRARHGLGRLRASPALMRSAQGYSHSLMKRDRFGHSGLARAGRFHRLGEALEYHSGRRARPGLALRLLLRSPMHRHLILSQQMRVVGAGVTRGRFQGARGVIWVLHFGRR